MPRYIIESDHTVEDCVRVLHGFLQAGAHYLQMADWGCEDGVHTGWLVVEANDDRDAALMAPPVFRKDAKVVRLNKFSPERVLGLHNKEMEEQRGGKS